LELDAILPAVVDRACGAIRDHADGKVPLLLYLPLTAPHTPIAVAAEWRGKSGLNAYADYVMETDAMVGRVMEAVQAASTPTVVVFASDNGFAAYAGRAELEAKGHFPSGPLRGFKADAWEGGHRLPFIVRWPGVVRPGVVCNQTVCAADLFATLAQWFGDQLPPNAGEDSVSLMPLLRGEDKPIHESLVHESGSGVYCIRSGRWKAIFGPGSGPPKADAKPLLYDLDADLGETTDLAAQHPDEVKRLSAMLQKIVDDGRSTPGPPQKNDVPVKHLPEAEGSEQ
jgi:arylsulfatase A-like enzyme